MRLYSALIGLSLIWGMSFVFIKWLLEPAGPWGTVFLRCFAAVVILLPFLWMKRDKITKPIPWKPMLIVGVFNAGLPWGLIALSETQINSSTAAVLNALTPICTGLVGFLFFSILLKKRQWLGIGLGFAGILVLMEFNVGQLFHESFVGIGTMVLTTISYGFATQYTKKHLQSTSVLLLTTCSLAAGALVGFVGTIFTGTTAGLKPALLTDPLILFAIVGLGCFGSGIAHLIFYYIIKNSSAEFATSVTYLVPITAMIWGYVLLDEPITKNLAIGLLIIFAGVYLATRKPKKEREMSEQRMTEEA
ncbi:DMT family transporter [Halobacillus naozhouensis]|uniref:EamA family transporter n=1 Tax=Halobacillus naozhouensis TaxID=554880 RepID=A0ABY8IZU1_9BACI|nr:EamA family transporter [Halobacillus naozhouensis]WFT75767.1 EamA family transporter [Halobacillus naozhouensis]